MMTLPVRYLVVFGTGHIGLTTTAATWAVSIVGIFSTVARIAIAPISDYFVNGRWWIYIILRGLTGLLLIPPTQHALMPFL